MARVEPMPSKSQPLLVTTQHRGVFFGYGDPQEGQTCITLLNARMIVYWSSDMHGVLGLASIGPSTTCRVSHPVPVLYLVSVTAIMICTPDAVKRIEKAPWKS
jgi:hypothetical protein